MEGDSSGLSKIDSLKEEISEAFLLSLLAIRGRAGVPSQLCFLWQEVWKVDLQAKHLTGLAGFFRGLLQSTQVRSEMESVPELLKLFCRTAWLKAEMSWPLTLASLRNSPRRRFFTNQTAATRPSCRTAPPCTWTSRVVWCRWTVMEAHKPAESRTVNQKMRLYSTPR